MARPARVKRDLISRADRARPDHADDADHNCDDHHHLADDHHYQDHPDHVDDDPHGGDDGPDHGDNHHWGQITWKKHKKS